MERPTGRQLLTHGLWFDNEALSAAEFYTTLFADASINAITRYGREGYEHHGKPEGSIMTVDFTLAGLGFMALNGGPHFRLNPSVSFFVVCESRQETDRVWNTLSEGGRVLMSLDKYDWSPMYGWVQDRFGLAWEVALGKISDVGQKITPSLLFAAGVRGRAEEAIAFYTSVFGRSGLDGILRYGPDEEGSEGTVKHAMFTLHGQKFMALDSAVSQHFTFNEAVTIMINCISQEEIDYYWERLTDGGEEGPCGWLKDRFGLSWQVESVELQEMLRDPDQERVARVSQAFLKMKKYDLAELRRAFDGGV